MSINLTITAVDGMDLAYQIQSIQKGIVSSLLPKSAIQTVPAPAAQEAEKTEEGPVFVETKPAAPVEAAKPARATKRTTVKTEPAPAAAPAAAAEPAAVTRADLTAALTDVHKRGGDALLIKARGIFAEYDAAEGAADVKADGKASKQSHIKDEDLAAVVKRLVELK